MLPYMYSMCYQASHHLSDVLEVEAEEGSKRQHKSELQVVCATSAVSLSNTYHRVWLISGVENLLLYGGLEQHSISHSIHAGLTRTYRTDVNRTQK